MAFTFKELKKKSGSAEALRIFREMTVRKNVRADKIVYGALVAVGSDKLAEKIRNCDRGQLCSSPYCEKCRNRAGRQLESRLQMQFQTVLGGNANLLQERWKYFTVLCELVDFDNFKIGELKASVDRARKVLWAFHRAHKSVFVQGAFEFELIDLDELRLNRTRSSSIKKQTLLAMLDGNNSRFTGKKLLVHFHAVLDIGNHDPDSIRKWFRQRYSKHTRQVDLTETHSNQNADEKIKNIGSYPFKNRLRYNPSFLTADFESGDYFSYKDAGKLITAYQKFMDAGGGSSKSLLIGIKGLEK